MQPSQELFRAENVSFAYERGPLVLDNLNFSVESGEKIVLLGENGSGKSTLFSLMTATEKPTSGKLYWKGQPYSYKSKFLRSLYSQLGLVFQDPEEQLFAASVEQEVSFGAVNLGLEEAEVRRRVEQALRQTRTIDFKDRPLDQLSFGEKKRVSIADLLVMDSQLLLLDEPTAWLDNRNSRQIREVLDELNQNGVTLILSTHDVDLAWSFAERIIILGDGHLLYDGPPEGAFQDSAAIAQAGLDLPQLFVFDQMLERYLPSRKQTTPDSGEEPAQHARSLAELEAKLENSRKL